MRRWRSVPGVAENSGSPHVGLEVVPQLRGGLCRVLPGSGIRDRRRRPVTRHAEAVRGGVLASLSGRGIRHLGTRHALSASSGLRATVRGHFLANEAPAV